MFYLATTTLASGTGGVPKQSIVTRSRAAIGADTKGVNASHSGVSSSRLKKKRTYVTKPVALINSCFLSCYIFFLRCVLLFFEWASCNHR